MTSVFRIPYEIVGDGLSIMEEYRKQIAANRAEAWKRIARFDPIGYRPGQRGEITAIYVPDGRLMPHFKTALQPDGNRLCCPMRTKVGKSISAELNDGLPLHWSESEVASKLSYMVASLPRDGYKIYWPGIYDFNPTGGPAFLYVPRKASDGWTPDPRFIEERRESAFMLAMEAHNDKVREIKAAESGASA